jgi:alkane 1-monooxygenase
MRLRFIRFLIPFIIFIGAINSFHANGWTIGLPLLFAWVLIPVLELCFKPNAGNLTEAEEAIARQDKSYDILLYIVVICQYYALITFLFSLKNDELTYLELAGEFG